MITISEEQIERARMLLARTPDGVEKAAANAINRAADGAKTAAVRKAREEYIVSAARVRDTIHINKASSSNMQASVTSRGRGMALSYFRIRPSQAPVKRPQGQLFAQVKRDGGGTIKGAFVARMQSGHVGVFNRLGKNSLPIVQRYGPSVPQMLGSKTVSEYVEEEAVKRLQIRFDHEVGRLMKE